MESAVSFAPLRPAGFVNFTGRGGARTVFCGAGRVGVGGPSLKIILRNILLVINNDQKNDSY